jgi:very-short-patch-repair endonuclease
MEADNLIVTLAESQFGVVGRRQVNEAGLSRKAVLHRIERGALISLSPEVLRVAGSPRTDHQLAMAGVLDAPPGAHLSHRSAAAWWGLPGFRLAVPIQVVIPWQGINRRTRLAAVHFHRDLPGDHLLRRGSLPVVSPALAIFLLAGTERAGRVARALDNAWARHLLTYEQLHQLLKALAKRGRNGIALMRELLAERPPDYRPPESGLEARVARLAADAGIDLRRQVDVGDDGWIGRVDFVVDGSPDVIEVLSQRYHGSVLDRASDTARFARLERSGRRVLTVWDEDVWQRPELVTEAIHRFWRVNSPL